ncbi:hypothetical protein JCM5353_003994 [Sporobolomyces roseus]
MRSNLLFVLFALLCAAFVAANPDAEPEAEPGRGGAQCGGRVIGSCQRGFSCTKNKSNKYFCKAIAKAPGPSGSRRPSVKRNLSSCEGGKVACPVPGLLHGFECVDVMTSLESCGDCLVLGGVDCSALPGVAGVACVNGFCRVEGCGAGFTYDFRKRSCTPNSFWQQKE